MRVRRLLKQDNTTLFSGKQARKSGGDMKLSDMNLFNKDSLI